MDWILVQHQCNILLAFYCELGCTYTHPHSHLHTHTHTYTHPHLHTLTLTHTHTYTHTHSHLHTPALTHTHTYTHSHLHTHTGEPVTASEYFTLTSFPSFLRHSSYPHTSTDPPPSEPHTTHTSTANTPAESTPLNNSFTPVDPLLKHTYMTPDLYGQPSLGKAVASSTPSSMRTRPFPHEPIPFQGLDSLSSERQGKGGSLAAGLGTLSDPKMAGKLFSSGESLSGLRVALDFGSASTVGSSRRFSKETPVMPLTPR